MNNEEEGNEGQVEKSVGRGSHSAMDLLRKYGMHDDVQDIMDMRRGNPSVKVTTLRPVVNIKPAVTGGHGHIITDDEIVKEGARKKRFPKVRYTGFLPLPHPRLRVIPKMRPILQFYWLIITSALY